MSETTWSDWRKKFKFKYIIQGEWLPSITLPADTHDYQSTTGTTPDRYAFSVLQNTLFGENGVIDTINQTLKDAALALEVDFLSYDSTGSRKLTKDSTKEIEWVNPNAEEMPTTTSGYLNPSFGYTYYSLLATFDPTAMEVGDCPEYTIYVTLKVSEDYILEDKPSFKWKFYTDSASKANEELTETITDKLDIFGNPVPPTVPQLRQKNDEGIYTFSTCTGWTRQEDGSFLASYTDTTVASLFTFNDKDIFEDAEPYHYGEKAPISGYFLPIGDNDDNDKNTDTDDILIQMPENNQYSNIVSIPGFTIGQSEESLQYIQKGTFPMLGDGDGRLKWESSDHGNSDDTTVTVTVTYDDTNSSITSITVSGDSTTKEDTKKETNTHAFNAQFTEIKRLGFILVGGGGGAGGYAEYDSTSSSGSTVDYACPGGGGGGGEIVCGVLNVEAPPIVEAENGHFVLGNKLAITKAVRDVKITSLDFIATIGSGGEAGTSDQDNGGSAGASGGDSFISLTINYKYTTDGTNWAELSFTKSNLITAVGGKGGSKGTIEVSKIEGGAGGSSEHTSSRELFTTKNWCGVCYSVQGSAGASITLDSTNYLESRSDGVSAKSWKLYFSSQPVDDADNNTHSQSKTLKAVAAIVKVQDKDNSEGIAGCTIPGGHSYGAGAGVGATEESAGDNAGWGGGGAGGIVTNPQAKGGNGFFGVYY